MQIVLAIGKLIRPFFYNSLVIVLCSSYILGQGMSYEFGYSIGYNSIIKKSSDEIEGGITYGLNIVPIYWINKTVGVSLGLGIEKSKVLAVRDYSPLFGCDHNGNGTGDPLNSYFYYGRDFLNLNFPINLHVNLNWLELFGGIEPSFIVQKRDRAEVVECGVHSKKVLKAVPILPWDPKIPNFGLNFGFGFNLAKGFRISPQIKYSLLKEDGENSFKFRQVYYYIGMVYRLFGQEEEIE